MQKIVFLFLIMVTWRSSFGESELKMKKFIYQNNETRYIILKNGTIDVDCGSNGNENTTWHMLPDLNIHIGKFIQLYDIKDQQGAYYCSSGSWVENVLHVQKIFMLLEEPRQREKSIEDEVKYVEIVKPIEREIHYVPREYIIRHEMDDKVIWEHPPGTILLDQGSNFYMPSYNVNDTKSFFYYRIFRIDNFKYNKVGKILIQEWEDKDFRVSVEGIVSYGAFLKILCHPSVKFRNNKVIFRKDDKIIKEGYIYKIKKYEETSFGNYTCEMLVNNTIIKRKEINLIPVNDFQSKIIMKAGLGRYYYYYIGGIKHLYCNVLKEEGHAAKDITWTFQDIQIAVTNHSNYSRGKVFEREDTISASILTLKDMDLNNEGSYKCFEGFRPFTVNLLMKRDDILLNIYPIVERAVDNVEDFVEFTCDINISELSVDVIKWSFIPITSKEAETIPKEAKISLSLSLTSSLSIDNVLKKHEGIYVCQVYRKKVFANLYVTTAELVNVTKEQSYKDKMQCTFNNKIIKDSQNNSLFEKKQNDVHLQCDVENEIEKIKKENNDLIKEMEIEINFKNSKIDTLITEMEFLKKETKEVLLQYEKEDGDQIKEITLLKLNNYLQMKCETIDEVNIWLKCAKVEVAFIWKIDQISLKEDQLLNSEPFYSHNYKFILVHKYDFKNPGFNKDYGFMLGFRIMKNYDYLATWPKRLNVIISLIDQTLIETYGSVTFKYVTSQTGPNPEFLKLKDKDGNIIYSTLFYNYSSIIAKDSLVISCIIFEP